MNYSKIGKIKKYVYHCLAAIGVEKRLSESNVEIFMTALNTAENHSTISPM